MPINKRDRTYNTNCTSWDLACHQRMVVVVVNKNTTATTLRESSSIITVVNNKMEAWIGLIFRWETKKLVDKPNLLYFKLPSLLLAFSLYFAITC
jgi:hypothetical protein